MFQTTNQDLFWGLVWKKEQRSDFSPSGHFGRSGVEKQFSVRKRSGVKISVQDLTPELGKIDRFWLWSVWSFLRSKGSRYNSFTTYRI